MPRTCLAVFVCLVAGTGAAMQDTLVQRLVSEVSQDSVRATIQRLQNFGTREARTDSNRAAVQYVRERLVGYGCDSVYLHHFDTVYGFGPNVIGVKYGESLPEAEYILIGHIDCIADPPDVAPGADDNGSGVAVILEACRVLAGHWFNHTVRFICQNAEEYTSGAARYVQMARERGDSIAGALNIDMVGYGLDGRDSVFALGKAWNPDCSRLLNGFCSSSREYTALKVRRISASRDTCYGYDHIYFWMFGYPALTVSELIPTPCIHSRGDTIGSYHYPQCGVNDVPMCTEVAKAAVATLATLAQVNGIAGLEETPNGEVQTPNVGPTIVRGILSLPVSPFTIHHSLFDKSGRKVMALKPGPNDVSGLAPGVYFVRSASSVMRDASSVTKVIVTK